MKYLKILSLILLGYALHFAALELGNISSQYRWQQCILKMRSGEFPYQTPSGQHYCLATVWAPQVMPTYEKVLLYKWDLYEEMDKRFLQDSE